MEKSDLRLESNLNQDGQIIIDLKFTKDRYKKILEHVSALSKEERDEALEQLERQIIGRKE